MPYPAVLLEESLEIFFSKNEAAFAFKPA